MMRALFFSFHRGSVRMGPTISFLTVYAIPLQRVLVRFYITSGGRLPVVEKFDMQKELRALTQDLRWTSLEEEQPLAGYFGVFRQHLLGTTGDMLHVLKDLGLKDAVVCGKSYSTHKETAERIERLGFTVIPDQQQIGYGFYEKASIRGVTLMWNAAVEKVAVEGKNYKGIVILDDGGEALDALPPEIFAEFKGRIVGIEQTTHGTSRGLESDRRGVRFGVSPFPIINLAESWIKKFEYPYVAEVVFQNVLSDIEKNQLDGLLGKEKVIGIVGGGRMGQEIAIKFKKNGFNVDLYEQDHLKRDEIKKSKNFSGIVFRTTLFSLFAEANIIVGCTPTDVTLDRDVLDTILDSRRSKRFYSATSTDMQFRSLLREYENRREFRGAVSNSPDQLFKDLVFDAVGGATITVLAAGLPYNFSRNEHSVAPDKIFLTRAALLLSVLMAVEFFDFPKLIGSAAVYKLCEERQSKIAERCILRVENDPFKGVSPASIATFFKSNAIGKLSQGESASEVEKKLL